MSVSCQIQKNLEATGGNVGLGHLTYHSAPLDREDATVDNGDGNRVTASGEAMFSDRCDVGHKKQPLRAAMVSRGVLRTWEIVARLRRHDT